MTIKSTRYSLSMQFVGVSPTDSVSALDKMLGMLHLKTRHVFTRDNRLRLRYVVSAFTGVALVLSLYAGGLIQPQDDDMLSIEHVSEIEPEAGLSEAGPILSYLIDNQSAAHNFFSGRTLDDHRDETGQIRRDPRVKESVELTERRNENESPAAEEIRITIQSGDTLAGVLIKAGLDTGEAQSVVNKVAKHFEMRDLRPGQVFDVTLEPADTSTGYQLADLSFAIDPIKTIEVKRTDSDELIANLHEKEVSKQREARQVIVKGSIYASADRANIPDRVTSNAIKLFSYAVDFQRDVKAGDKLEVLYDSYQTPDGYIARTGDIIFARLNVGGRQHAIYRYEDSQGKVDYYTEDGRSIRKSTGLMRTPVAYGRMSSGYGMRKHPILGYTKMHTGIDFAAPVGTPVFASGDGVVERVGRFGAYGNYVRIRHSSKVSSAYAHLSRYAKGLRVGSKVKQGQVIAYVGNTGRSTGPHLHYEILVNNVHVNPSSVKYTGDNSLKGKELQNFKRKIRSLGAEYTEEMKNNVRLASVE
jgi:murein DD-endopeptidase MepM/ murein hydrolase activator NlpD